MVVNLAIARDGALIRETRMVSLIAAKRTRP
jgi:hypothetical protein